MNSYEAKLEARRERLEARAERLNREGAARVKSGMDRLSAIPFGQPILVGHHSEKRDRNYRSKAGASIDKGMNLQKLAGEAAARAAAVGTGGISSDDPEAVVKLKEQLAECEKRQTHMVAVNKEHRAKAGPKWKEARAMGLGYASWELSNNSANIRRIKARIEELTRNANREHKETERADGIKIVENVEANRVQIIFPGKPSAAARTILKRHGFRWSPYEGAWQRHLNGRAVWIANAVLEDIARLNNGGENGK